MNRYLVGLVFVGWLCGAAHGQDQAIRADAHIDRARIALSEQLQLTFTVEAPKNLEVERIEAPSQSPTWEAKLAKGPEFTPLANGRTRWRQSFRLEPLQPGQLTLVLAPLRYRLGAGPWTEHTWKDLTIEVTTSVLDPAATALRGNSQIEQVPPKPSRPWWPLAGGLIALLALAGLLRWRRQRPAASVPALPPDLWALRELDHIDRQALAESGAVEHYHRLLSDVLRRFLELRLGLPATQQTTVEFLNSATVPEPARDLLRDFLQRCDLAKFARAEYGVEECQATGQLARDLIGQFPR